MNEAFDELFDDQLSRRVDKLASDPADTETLVEAITLYHMVIEGVLALTGQHFIIDYNTEQGTLPAFVEGFGKVARDEHRHIAFGVRFLTDMAARGRALPRRRSSARSPSPCRSPTASWSRRGQRTTRTGRSSAPRERRPTPFAAQCLTRRLKVIGLA